MHHINDLKRNLVTQKDWRPGKPAEDEEVLAV
jgi:hypothetical protein